MSSLPLPKAKLDNYDSEGGAQRYKDVYRQKLGRRISDRLERRILGRMLAYVGPCQQVLDLPCGAGRLYSLLQDSAEHVIEADWSSTMLALNRNDHDSGARAYLRCSALEIPLEGRSVDLAISIRLSHHILSLEGRRQHLRELFRVSRRFVIATWFSSTSIKNVLRVARRPFDHKPPKNTLRRSQVLAVAREAGYEEVHTVPLSRLSSGHSFGLFER